MHSIKRSAALALVALVSFAGCKGETGDTGPAGPTGPVTTTNESCMVCHASTRIAPTAASHATAFAGGYQETLALTNVTVTNVGGRMQVAFHVGNSAGGQTVAGADVRVMIAGLVPKSATPASSIEAADYFQLWRTERTAAGYDPFGTLTASPTGDHTYLTTADISQAPVASTIQRILLRVGKADNFTANATYDFDKADPTMAAVANPRVIVPTASCDKCHFERIADHGHGGGYTQSSACIVCHSPRYPTTVTTDMLADGFDFVTMVHQLHAAYDHTKGGTAPGMDWSAVTYPAQINDCTVCHDGGTASARYHANPNAIACTSCHFFVKFTDSPGYSASTVACGDAAWSYPSDCSHSPANATTADCAGCHPATAIDGYHDPTENRVHLPTQVNTPEFDVAMTIAPPAAGTFYVPGIDTLSITITLTARSDGSAVPTSFYTAARRTTAGTTSTTALTNARLYVYGPRETPKPVLTAAAAVTPVPTQYTQLMAAGATDPNVDSDATGFKYSVAIPAGFPAGTYFVRFTATNYGYVSDTDYVTDSSAFQAIQIGTATAGKKVSGDACTQCHGDHLAAFHDARHGVKFDTDECNSCHDQSGNHAVPLANRVHAIHASSTAGDLYSPTIDGDPAGLRWSEVEYPVSYRSGSGLDNAVPPGATMRCAVCHTSGNTQFQTNVGEVSCMGCHADVPGALDHFRQNGGGY